MTRYVMPMPRVAPVLLAAANRAFPAKVVTQAADGATCCAHDLHTTRVWNRHKPKCGRAAKVCADGRFFCGYHNPAKPRRRQKESGK